MQSLSFRTIVFDLDGTLADTAPDLAMALNHALEALGRPSVLLPQVRDMIGHGTRALLAKGLAATGESNEALVVAGYPALMRHYEDHICDLTRPYPGTDHVLDALAANGIAIAMCTNKPARMTDGLIAALGWQHRFAAVIGGDTLPVSKPDPEPLLTAITRAGGGPAAFVGDSIIDLQTARAAEVPCVLARFGYSDRPVDDLGADAVISHFEELHAALAMLSAR